MKETVKNFLIARLPEIISVFVILAVFRVLFAFGGSDMSYYNTGLEISLFCLIVYLVFSFGFYKRGTSVKGENEELRLENEELKMKIISDKKSIQDYFALWVHQIKTPITAAKLIIENNVENSEERIKAQLIYIEQYTEMAINYLKIMNVDTDMDIAGVRLDDIIKPVLKKYSAIFIAKGIKLNYEQINKNVISDAKWLGILFEQFISNALKYTEKGSISIDYDGNNEMLLIKDTGIGIRSEDIPKIFDRGYSGFNGRINEKSSGLGLYLAKEIADKLGANIEVSSEVGKGSIFGLKFKSDKDSV